MWKEIEGYDGKYLISNQGQVKSLKRNNGYIMKDKDDGHGYKRVRLCKKGIYEYKYIHRLVAETFVPNPDNFLVVNHKDENTYNNNAENLEWCTNEYNLAYGTSRKRAIEKCKKPINQYSKNGDYIKTWNSVKEASSYLKIDDSSITKCCKGKLKTSGGYIWKYRGE